MNMHNTSTSHLAAALKKHYQQILLPYERRSRGVDQFPNVNGGGAQEGAGDLSKTDFNDAPGHAEGGERMSSGGSLMSKRANANVSMAEVVKLKDGVERSNATDDEVIAYEPPLPGQELCELCGGGEDNESMLLCDRCSCGFHLYCLSPPLHSVPAGEWFCTQCLRESFGFGSTRVFKFHQYERQAHMFKHAFFDSIVETGLAKLSKKRREEGVAHSAEQRAMSGVRLNELEVAPEEVEWQFWNIVTTPDQPVEVLYGSDLDTLQYGSGFPRPLPNASKPLTVTSHVTATAVEPSMDRSSSLDAVESPKLISKGKAKALKELKAAEEQCAKEKDIPGVRRFATAGWNLNNLCQLDRCVLAHCNDNVSGMVVPWLYVGMLFSSFCWHVEDHFAHSINYMHWGAPKTWYGVPGSQATSFEGVMAAAVPDLMQDEAGLLYRMVTMVPPDEAVKAGVDVCHLLQHPGSFVITWPVRARSKPIRCAQHPTSTPMHDRYSSTWRVSARISCWLLPRAQLRRVFQFRNPGLATMGSLER